MADIRCSLASRAAEEIFLGTGLTGVTTDLEQATRVAVVVLESPQVEKPPLEQAA